MTRKITRIVLFTLIGIAGLCALGIYFFSKSMCEDDTIGKYASPNTKHTVTYYVRNCGATTWYVDNIELDGKTILQVEARGEKYASFSVTWVDDKKILIGVATSTSSIRIFKGPIDNYRDIEIQFDQRIKNGYIVNQ